MKHVISFVFVALLGSFVVAAPAAAQVAAGLNEVAGRGSFESGKYIDDERRTQFELSMFYGRFLTDRIEVGPSVTYNKLEGENATGFLGGFVDYHFGDTAGTLVPYLEVAAGQFLTGTDGVDESMVAIGPGVKWFVGEGAGAFSANAQYRRHFVDIDGVGSGSNELSFTIGVSIFFGR